MKLKLALLVASAVAGGGASVALADHGHDAERATACTKVHLSGTLAAGSLSLVVAHANHDGAAAGSTVALVLPAGARANVEACETGTGTAAVLTLRGAELHVSAPKPTVSTTTATTPSH
jgi:hypothetical protein